MNKYNYIYFFAYSTIIISLFIISYVIITDEISSCTNDPLNYFIDDIKTTTDAENVIGSYSLMKNGRSARTVYFGDRDKIISTNETNFNYTILK